MAGIEEIRQARLDKRAKLESLGIDCYPSTTSRTHTLAQVASNFELLSQQEVPVTLAGRVMSLRGQGGVVFFDLFDGTGRFQGLLKKDENPSYPGTDADAFSLFQDTVDMGDIVEASGTLFITNRGANTLLVKSWRMLTKTLQAIPDSWYGLKDEDERFRKRYIDLLLNDESRTLFMQKAKFWHTVRTFLINRQFLEVETPTLEVTTGGAEARPFKTHHNDFDLDVFLRISVGELWQKRLLAAGFPQIFEIGRVYRNEGSSAEHVQEFTNCEFYAGYMNLQEGKDLVRELYRTIAKEIFGTTSFSTRGHSFDLASEWKEIDYAAEIKERTGIDIFSASEKDMMDALSKLGVQYEGKNKERLTDTLWKYCRKQISGPAFLVNHPKVVAPLSKTNKDNPETTEMFQVILAGSEIGRAHAELNDPVDQAERFKTQQSLIESGDEEAMMADHEFVEMLEYGMPPSFGFGFGDRLFSFLADKPIRETQFFPLMRPKE